MPSILKVKNTITVFLKIIHTNRSIVHNMNCIVINSRELLDVGKLKSYKLVPLLHNSTVEHMQKSGQR